MEQKEQRPNKEIPEAHDGPARRGRTQIMVTNDDYTNIKSKSMECSGTREPRKSGAG
jgi:hypothetical protein